MPDSASHPKWLGRTDWENIATFDLEAASAALNSLLELGHAIVPIYDLTTDAITGTTIIETKAQIVVAEGLFGVAIAERLAEEGRSATLLLLQHNAAAVAAQRVRRDLTERRLSAWLSVARSLRLLAREPVYRRAAKHAGARRVGRSELLDILQRHCSA